MYVYFIKQIEPKNKRGPIKIGVAYDIERRMLELQTGNPYQLELVAALLCQDRREAERLEARFHSMFRRKRIRGEWFKGNIRLSRATELFPHKVLEVETESVEVPYGRELEIAMGNI